MTRYETIAEAIADRIRQGLPQAGQRLPGTRVLAREHQASISTIMQAQRLLERWELVEARPRSGYWVKPERLQESPLPSVSEMDSAPTLVTNQQMVLDLVQATARPDVIPLGAAVPDPSCMPIEEINKAIRQVSRLYPEQVIGYQFPPGSPWLRRQLAKHMATVGVRASEEEVVITNGCHEALVLALKTVAQPGDVIAIESPAYYGLLQVIESLGLQALEIPTHPQTGLSLSALTLAIEKWPVKACVVVSHFSNPLGCSLSDEDKKQLVELLSQHKIPLIENDIYGDLGFQPRRPIAAKAYDKQGWVIYCSSFSKTLSPGLRVGWVCPGRWIKPLTYQKYTTSLAAPTLPQLAIAHYLQQNAYERHLRKLKPVYEDQVARVSATVLKHFPEGTRVTQPQGGMVIWVELPQEVDALALYRRALGQGISIAPGPVFSPSGKYRHHIRLNCSLAWNDSLQWALVALAKLVA